MSLADAHTAQPAMDCTGRGGDRVVIIAASSRADQLDSALRRPGRLDTEVEIGVPSPAQRLDIFR